MEKNRGTRVIAIIALLAGVAGLSLGFAALSSTLVIQSQATVNPDSSEFKVYFSKTAAPNFSAADVTPTIAADSEATATDATINNDGTNPTISNLHATFKNPGESVTYTFYAYNKGKYLAYLRSIAFENVDEATTTKVCTAGKDENNVDTTASMVTEACKGISVSVKVGEENALPNPTSATTYDTYTNHSLSVNASEQVTVTISYAANSDIADGPFEVEFGDIKLTYSSIDKTSSVPGE